MIIETHASFGLEPIGNRIYPYNIIKTTVIVDSANLPLMGPMLDFIKPSGTKDKHCVTFNVRVHDIDAV